MSPLIQRSALSELSQGLHGIYFLFSGKKLIYIGSSENIRRRLFSHKHSFTAFRYLIHRGVLLRTTEALHILKHRPTLNRNCIGAGKATLTVRVSSDIKTELLRRKEQEALNISAHVNGLLRPHFPRKNKRAK